MSSFSLLSSRWPNSFCADWGGPPSASLLAERSWPVLPWLFCRLSETAVCFIDLDPRLRAIEPKAYDGSPFSGIAGKFTLLL